jgi:hypothetical protein
MTSVDVDLRNGREVGKEQKVRGEGKGSYGMDRIGRKRKRVVLKRKGEGKI